jgi:hypothetical protein
MYNELIAQVWVSVQRVAQYSWKLLRRYAIPFMASAVVVLAVAFAWATYRDLATKRFTLLVGPYGGSGMGDARLIKAHLEKAASTWYGPACHVRLETTDGYEENRRRISQDADGQVFGFAHDGFGSAAELDKVRVLLPLDKTHLHIVVRKPKSSSPASSPVDVAAESDQPKPDTAAALFANSLDRLAPGKVYLGPADSGTRQLAEAVLKYYRRDADQFPTFGIANWTEMRAALRTGAIDVAFCAGPKNSSVIQQIANDNDCILVGLNGDREAICQDCSHLEPSEFVARSYSKEFCGAGCHTIASRRVILCSPAMSDKDAYLISKAAFESLRGLGPDVGFRTVQSAPNYRDGLRYELHNGAVLFSQNTGPGFLSDWIRTSNYVLITIGVFLATQFFRTLNSRSKQGNTPPVVNKTAALDQTATDSDALELECRNLLLELQSTALGATAETCAGWNSRAVKVRDEISVRQKQGTISAAAAAGTRAMLKEIFSEVGFHRRNRARPSAPATPESQTMAV